MLKKFLVLSLIFSLFLISCGTTEQETEPEVTEPEITEVIQEEEETEIIETEVEIEEPVIEDEPEEIQEEEPEIEEEPDEEIDEVEDVEDVVENDEFTRSTNEMNETISFDQFSEDKAAILDKITELDNIMSNFEYENWRKCIEAKSLEYYSNPLNLRKAQKKLPDKSIQLKGPRDYFKYVFIPSRKMSQVEEIRYISPTYIKAVEVREEEDTTLVYYYFVKEDGKWLVRLPEVE